MLIARTLAELRAATQALRAHHQTLSLVPTMGALHAGHTTLITTARQAGGAVAASIFVNPLQFAANEDLARYPRDEAGDLAKLDAAGCHLVWMPDVATMYPPGGATTITPQGPALGWEGDARPGHFTGVATVCCKLFGQVRPDRAFFGEKDWQQLQVVTRMVADLALPLDIIGVETVREADGLAMSSRNRFLSEPERALAPALPRAMRAVITAIADGRAADNSLRAARAELTALGFAVDYLALVDGPTLSAIPTRGPGARLIAAARLGTVRLLDNMAA
jgi:pantoate--beta-alanine ligase